MGSRFALAIGLFVALAACNKVDSAKFEKTVEGKLEASGVHGAKVSCPKNVDAKKGNKFSCTITIEGSSYDYDVEITDVNGKDLQLNTAFRQGAALVKAKVVDYLVKGIKDQTGEDGTVDCGKEALLFAEDGKLECTGTVADKHGPISMDVDGDTITGWHFDPQ